MKKILISLVLSLITLFCVNTHVQALEGIDVSEFQGDIDFSEVAKYGIEVVYIRSSASNSYIDAKFERNYNGAKENNLKIGFYHYVTARSIEEAKEQARFFASVIAGKEADCLLAMDFEVFTGLTTSEVNEISRAFLETLEELTEKKAVVYSDAYNAGRVFDRSISSNYPLWIAQYGVREPQVSNWKNWIGWQYSDEGRISGIYDNVDRDTFKDEILLEDTNVIKEPNIKPEDKMKIVYYRIKKGDTLSGIASIYNTSVSNLVTWNNLRNPNLIFPNQVLKIYTDYKYSIASTGSSNTYIVKRGDTLSRIARIYNVTVSNLVTWNNIKNPNLIYPGEKITIKRVNNNHLIRYIVKENDTLSLISEEYNVSIYELQTINKIKNINKILVGEVIYIPETYIY